MTNPTPKPPPLGEPPSQPAGKLVLVSAWQRRVDNEEALAALPASQRGDDDDHDDDGPPWPLPPPPRPPSSGPLPLDIILDDHEQARRADDKVVATTHVLRVRSRLTPGDQRRFDELILADAGNQIIRTVLSRDEDDAVEALRRRISGEPVAATLDAVSALSPDDQAVVMSMLLLKLSPVAAERLIRTYLAPRKDA